MRTQLHSASDSVTTLTYLSCLLGLPAPHAIATQPMRTRPWPHTQLTPSATFPFCVCKDCEMCWVYLQVSTTTMQPNRINSKLNFVQHSVKFRTQLRLYLSTCITIATQLLQLTACRSPPLLPSLAYGRVLVHLPSSATPYFPGSSHITVLCASRNDTTPPPPPA